MSGVECHFILAEMQVDDMDGDMGIVSELKSEQKSSAIVLATNEWHKNNLALIHRSLDDCAIISAVDRQASASTCQGRLSGQGVVRNAVNEDSSRAS